MRDFDDVYHSVVETNSRSVESIPTLSTYRRMRLYQLFERATQPAEGSIAELYFDQMGQQMKNLIIGLWRLEREDKVAILTDKEQPIVKGALDLALTMEDLLRRCLEVEYTHVDNDGDFAIETQGDTLILLFQQTHSITDWISNFDFAAKPYKDMEVKWRCHRGFLRVWKSIEPYIESYVKDPKYKKIRIVGYSHGAAIATLAHEYCWFWRPDLRKDGLVGFGFGCPRCYFGWFMKKKLRERWKTFYPVRNLNDIVTHVPPVLFGFRHVNHVVKLGDGHYEKDSDHPRRLKCVLAHYDRNYLYSLNDVINRLRLMYYTCLYFFDIPTKL